MKQTYNHLIQTCIALTSAVSVFFMLVALAPTLVACSADDYADAGSSGKSTVTLILPGMLAQGLDSDEAGTDYIPVGGDAYGENPAEGGVDSEKGLWFFAFPKEQAGRMLKRKILPTDLKTKENNHKQYSIELEKGEYTFYMAGNISGLGQVNSAYELKQLILRYTAPLTDLKPGNLPLYCEGIDVTVDRTALQPVDMHLTFLCSKVRLKMKKPDTEPAEVKLAQLQLSHVATASVVDEEACRSLQTLSFLGDEAGHEINIPLSDNNGITLAPEAQTVATFYLPEYYTGGLDDRTPTRLLVTVGKKKYTLPLGGDAYDSTTATEAFAGGDLKRSVCYDMTLTPGRGITLTPVEWTTETLNLSFLSWLRVSRTGEDKGLSNGQDLNNYEHNKKTRNQILVTSQHTDSITYSSSAEAIALECVDLLDGKPLVVATDAPKNGRILFSVNPEIPFSAYKGKTTGTVKIAIKANNLIKYINVQYNVTPFLRISPQEVEIRTLEGTDQDEYAVSFETNLGGIVITPNELVNATNGDKVSISYNPGESTGIILLKAAGKVVNSWSDTFKVSPAISGFEEYAQEVSVTVLPVLGNYRIHFIAINDDRYDNEDWGTRARIHRELVMEDGKQPSDGWNAHKIYIYTQYGMSSGGEIPQSVWYFFKIDELGDKPYWPGVNMQPDMENPGWMLYSLPFNFEGKCKELPGTVKTPVPGETLIMFNNAYEPNNHMHRYPYDMEPGVSLFDFSNREGWFVYDCTTGNFEFYNSKPEIYLATFKMYHLKEMPVINNWYRKYGRKKVDNTENDYEPITVWDDATISDEYLHITEKNCTIDGWKLSELPLWCVRGKENKSIIVKHQADGDTPEADKRYGILFGGKRFKDNTGYFKEGEWHEGVPEPITTKEIKQ